MFLTAELPKAIFRTAELRGTIKVGAPGADAFRIDVEAASTALKGALGVDIDLRVETPGD